jgi:hypothetical protein
VRQRFDSFLSQAHRADMPVVPGSGHSLGGVGSWEWEIGLDTTVWSDGLYRIFARDPNLPPPNYAEHPSLYTDRPAHAHVDANAGSGKTKCANSPKAVKPRPG